MFHLSQHRPPTRIHYIGLMTLLLSCLFLFNAQAETSQQKPAQDILIDATGITYYAVERDTLLVIAQKFTGKSSNWQTIGKLNRIRNDRSIPIGTAIFIPSELLLDVPSVATVVALAGAVTETKKDGAIANLAVEAKVFEGSQITTSKNGFITLALPDESRISIPSNSQVSMAKLRMTQYTKSPRTEIRLVQGRVESKITPLSKNQGRFEVTTPLSIAGVRGTHFRVGLNENGIANEVLTGGVAVGKIEKPNALVLPAGQGNIINKVSVGKATTLLPAPSLEQGFELQERITLQFAVLPQVNAVNYRAQISLDPESQHLIAESMAKNLRFKFDDIEDGQYFIRTTAIDSQGLEGMPSVLAFKMKARPEPPFPLQPKKKIRSESVTFNWTQAADAKTYRLQVAPDALFQKILIDQEGLNGVEFVASNLVKGHYFWRIATIKETKGQLDQGPYSFPEAFELLAPQTMNAFSDAGSDSLEFSWPSEPDQSFLVQISEDKDFKKMFLSKETKEASLKIPRPASGNYFIRVRATDPDGFVGRFSSTQKFEIFQRWTTSNGDALQSIGGVVRPNQ